MMKFPTEWKSKSHVPNHQPAICVVFIGSKNDTTHLHVEPLTYPMISISITFQTLRIIALAPPQWRGHPGAVNIAAEALFLGAEQIEELTP